MRNKLNSNIGLIIKYSDYFLEAFTYDEHKITFIDCDDNEIDLEFSFIYEDEIKDYMESLKPYIECYKLIKPMK